MDHSVQVMVSYGFCHKFVHDRCLGTKRFLQKKTFTTNHDKGHHPCLLQVEIALEEEEGNMAAFIINRNGEE